MSVIKDTPLSEITLRRYEKPDSLSGRNLVKKLCLSLGLLQLGDSRDVVVDVLRVLLDGRGELMTSDQIQSKVMEFRNADGLEQKGVAPSNIRRQIKRLRDLFIAEKISNSYRITEHTRLKDTFNERIERYMLPSILDRVREYMDKVDGEYFGS